MLNILVSGKRVAKSANVNNVINKRPVFIYIPCFLPYFLSLPELTTQLSPPIAVQMSHNEGRIALALQAYQQGHFSNLKAACTSYDAPYSTTRDRADGAVPRRDFKPRNKKLTDLEESILI